MRKYIRSSARVPLQLPIEVHWKSPAGRRRRAQGTTANISGTGVFLSLPARIQLDTSINFIVFFRGKARRIAFRLMGNGRVIRCSGSAEPPGIAIIIDDYCLRPVARRR
jgi:hypothetical protein